MLTEEQRRQVWQRIMQENTEPFGTLTKQDLRAAVDAVDDWIEANAASYNQAIPQPARGQLTARQKSQLLMLVVTRRF
jgi:hypothetical protein